MANPVLKILWWSHVKIFQVFGIKESNVKSTNPFVLLATRFVYYHVRILKPLYVIFFSLTSIFSSSIIKTHLSK